MKKYSIILMVAAMGLLAACEKEFDNNRGSSLDIAIAPLTKTHMDAPAEGKCKVYWSEGDAIAVNGSFSDALSGIGETASRASFHFTDPVTAPYDILYPSAIYSDDSHVELPAVQTYKSSGFADGMAPMAGYSADGSNIALHHLCAVLQVSIKRSDMVGADEDRIWSVSFAGRSGEQVCGIFSIDYENATLTGTSSDDAYKSFQVVSKKTTSVSDAVSYYLVAPALNYADGFDIVITDENAHTMTLKVGVGGKTLEAGKLYQLTEVSWAPNGTATGIEIASAQDLIDFAEAYNAGGYADTDPLIVTVTADLAFDAGTSADFNTATGIGLKIGVNTDVEDNYFNGTFNGGGHTISGLDATVPLFVATGSSGVVNDLNLDNTCSFTFTHANTMEGMFASVVGYHKGKLNNVSSAANISLADVSGVAKMTSLGGLVGRATTGEVTDSEYSGIITVPAGFTGTAKLIIGGLVGRFSNAGSVTGSSFKGGIGNEAQITSTDKENSYTVIGGVVGHIDGGGSVTSCSTTADNATVGGGGSYSGTKASIVHKSTIAYHSSVGGIVGELVNGSVSSCSNAATIFNTVIKAGADSDAQDASARYMRVGGIVGTNQANGVVSGCTNNGAITHRSNPRLQAIGGIVGWNKAQGSVSACTNNGAIALSTAGAGSYSARIPNLGGVIGENYSTAVSDLHNTANLQISRLENNAGAAVRFGGVIGYTEASVDGGANKLTNSGQVYFNSSVANPALGYNLGGVVGYSKGGEIVNAQNSGEVHFSVTTVPVGLKIGGVVGQTSASVGAEGKPVSNSGYVHSTLTSTSIISDVRMGGIVGHLVMEDGSAAISHCSNVGGDDHAGEVYLSLKAGKSYSHTNNYLGGILSSSDASVGISDCTNSGYVHGGNSEKVNGTTCYVGGIVGYLSGESSISDCINSGDAYNDHSSNSTGAANTAYSGGIAGQVIGSDTHQITISGCEHNTTALHSRRGYLGGIVGYANYVDISDCTASTDIAGSSYFPGGIAGFIDNGSIKDCEMTGESVVTSQAQILGGIVAKLGASTVEGCSSHVTTMTGQVTDSGIASAFVGGGAIAGTSVAASTIKDCHYKASGTITGGEGSPAPTWPWGICSDTNFADDGSNVADL